jgi:hypothetical protein
MHGALEAVSDGGLLAARVPGEAVIGRALNFPQREERERERRSDTPEHSLETGPVVQIFPTLRLSPPAPRGFLAQMRRTRHSLPRINSPAGQAWI